MLCEFLVYGIPLLKHSRGGRGEARAHSARAHTLVLDGRFRKEERRTTPSQSQSCLIFFIKKTVYTLHRHFAHSRTENPEKETPESVRLSQILHVLSRVYPRWVWKFWSGSEHGARCLNCPRRLRHLGNKHRRRCR